jgi:hypothetical protein
MSLDATDEIISEIYEAAAVPEFWPKVLGQRRMLFLIFRKNSCGLCSCGVDFAGT